jgi:hypothetical protein
MKSSTSQQTLIHMLLKKLELNTPSISIMHRDIFARARLWSSTMPGKDLSAWISGLNGFQAGLLITQLKVETENA